MSLLGKYTKSVNLDPVKRIAENKLSILERKLENTVTDLFSDTLTKAGLSSTTSHQLASSLGDSIKKDLADKYFNRLSDEISRVTSKDICDGITPNYAPTASGQVRKIEAKVNEVSGVDTNKILQYPSQLGKYYMSMKFREYVRPAPQVAPVMKFSNAISLPLPRSLGENFNINVTEKSLGALGGVADMIQTTTSGAGSDYSPTEAAIFNMATSMLEGLSDGVASNLYAYMGAVPNPHLAAMFQGVSLRQHQFEWTFAPRNPQESAVLQNIILRLKQNSLPVISAMGTPVFQYPLMCQIEMQPWAGEDADLITFKPALLESIRVNYSPNGIPSYFAGTMLPTFIQISLSFIETTYFTSNDFGESDATKQQNAKLKQGIDAFKDAATGILGEGTMTQISDTIQNFNGIMRGDRNN